MLACVVSEDTGVVVCLTRRGHERASWGGRLLAAVARDRTAAPVAGDWVDLHRWSDGRLTVERVLRTEPGETGPHAADGTAPHATVVPLRRRG